jgi:hypothetical protein
MGVSQTDRLTKVNHFNMCLCHKININMKTQP